MFFLKLFSYQKHSLTCNTPPSISPHWFALTYVFKGSQLSVVARRREVWLAAGCLRSKSDHEYIANFQDLLSIFNNTFDISHKITSDLGFLTYQEPRSKSLINVLLWLICSNLWWEFSALYISLDHLIWSFLTSQACNE